jgi:hypothetical protein
VMSWVRPWMRLVGIRMGGRAGVGTISMGVCWLVKVMTTECHSVVFCLGPGGLLTIVCQVCGARSDDNGVSLGGFLSGPRRVADNGLTGVWGKGR